MKKLFALAFVVLALPAMAQPVQQQASPEIVALQNKLLAEISSGLQCSAQIVAAQTQFKALTDELTAAKAELAKLKPPAPAAPAKP